MDVAALIVSLVAAAFTGWAGWYARGQKAAADRAAAEAKRSADAAERAASAAEGALGIERQREFERSRPDVVARFDRWLSEGNVALFALENVGGRAVDTARVEVVRDSRLVGFASDDTQPRRGEHEFGRLNPGQPETVEFVTLDKDAEHYEPSVKFRATFRIGDDEWNMLLSADLPPRSPAIW